MKDFIKTIDGDFIRVSSIKKIEHLENNISRVTTDVIRDYKKDHYTGNFIPNYEEYGVNTEALVYALGR